jgi:hypothetical protein
MGSHHQEGVPQDVRAHCNPLFRGKMGIGLALYLLNRFAELLMAKPVTAWRDKNESRLSSLSLNQGSNAFRMSYGSLP